VIRLARIVWALPVTLPAALLAVASGARLQRRDGILEASGGLLPGILRLLNPRLNIAAITLGHVVLARTEADLDRTRGHERVHVRQYERWGPLFPLLYLGASAALLLRRRDPYWDNPFECEARAHEARTSCPAGSASREKNEIGGGA
jgi:hypothetical protein